MLSPAGNKKLLLFLGHFRCVGDGAYEAANDTVTIAAVKGGFGGGSAENTLLNHRPDEVSEELELTKGLDPIAYQRAYQAARTRLLRHFGLCVACGRAEAQEGRTRCRRCALYASERTKKWLRKRTTISIASNSPRLLLRGGYPMRFRQESEAFPQEMREIL